MHLSLRTIKTLKLKALNLTFSNPKPHIRKITARERLDFSGVKFRVGGKKRLGKTGLAEISYIYISYNP